MLKVAQIRKCMTKIQTLKLSGTFCHHNALMSKVITASVPCMTQDMYIHKVKKNTEQELSIAESVVLN